MYIPFKSAHPRHTIKNYILGELQRYVRINTDDLNFLKIRNIFFLRMRNRGVNKHKLSLWFSEIKYSSRAKYLGASPGNICYFQGTRETQAESLLINTSERIMTEAISGVPDDTTEVVSEDEGTMVTLEEIVSLEGVFSKGTAKRSCPYSISLSSKKPKTFSVCPTVLLNQK